MFTIFTKIIMIVLGTAVLLAVIGVLILLYHAQSQDMWRDITRDEYEERYAKEIEARWHSQRVRVHYQMRIVDEMNQNVEDYYDEYYYSKRSV